MSCMFGTCPVPPRSIASQKASAGSHPPRPRTQPSGEFDAQQAYEVVDVTLPPLLTSAEVAEYLKYSVETVYKLARRGRLNGVKTGGRAPWRFTEQAVLDYLESAKLEPEHASAERRGSVQGRPARVPRRRRSHQGGSA